MVDTTSRATVKLTAEIDDLDVLAKAIREHLQASANAAQNSLEHTLDAGEALIRAKAQVKQQRDHVVKRLKGGGRPR